MSQVPFKKMRPNQSMKTKTNSARGSIETSIWWFVGCFLIVPILVLAERCGNFEIIFAPVSKESTETVDRGTWHTEKEKSQNMAYRVRIELKGVDKLQDLKVLYVVVYRAPNFTYSSRSSTRYATGEVSIPSLAPLEKHEFTTESVENSYREYNWYGGKNSYGKGQLKGIAVQIMQGEQKLAEAASSVDVKDAFEKAAKQKEENDKDQGDNRR